MIDFESFLACAKAYADLGGAVQEQLTGLDEGSLEPEACNTNALRQIAGFLRYAEGKGVGGTDYVLKMIDDHIKAAS